MPVINKPLNQRVRTEALVDNVEKCTRVLRFEFRRQTTVGLRSNSFDGADHTQCRIVHIADIELIDDQAVALQGKPCDHIIGLKFSNGHRVGLQVEIQIMAVYKVLVGIFASIAACE